MRSGICAPTAFTGMIVAMSLAVAVIVQAQAPAGPNRPGQVPEEYVVTPFGYFHPSCVVHLAKDEELLEGGRVIQRGGGIVYTVPACRYPHYTARGEMLAASKIEPPTINNSWVESASFPTSTSYGEILADWSVPSAPLSYDHQTVYFFPGLEQLYNDVTILQPVLGWNADFSKAWGIASWNCCTQGIAEESSPVQVNTGDLIVGTVRSTCGAGTLSCPNWNVRTQDQSTGGSTSLSNTPSEGQTFNWAFGGVLEAYSVVQCSDYPPDQYITFYPTLFDDNFNIVGNPPWLIAFYDSGLVQCGYNGQYSSSEVTLDYGSFTLSASTTGDGVVTSPDGYILCPPTCSQPYVPTTQVTLNASPTSGWLFSGWTGACSGVGPCNLTMTQNLSVTAVFLEPGQGFQFIPLAPCRLVDTRSTGNPIQGGTEQDFAVPQLGTCNIPGTAAAYALNVTVVPHEPLGYLTIWPAGEAQPNVSTMNSLDGRTKASAAIVPAGMNSAVSIFASNTTDLVLDIDGYFTSAAPQTLDFYPLTPCRVVDTRGPNSNLGGPFLAGGMERDFPISTSPCIPAGVNPQAYSFNATVVPHTAGTALGYLSLWPQGESQPTVSTLNNPTATDVANAAIVPAGANGGVAVFPSNDTDLVIDINGYFAAPGTGGLSLYPTAPCRVLDTRGIGSGSPIVGEYTVNVAGSVCSPPANAQAYVFNSTVVPSGALGYLSLWPDGLGQPVVSTLNALDGSISSNMAIVPMMNGSIDSYASNLTQLVLDISSYFAP